MNIMSEAHDRQYAPNMLGVSNATPHVTRATTLSYMQDRQVLCGHGNSSRGTPQCKHRGGRELLLLLLLLLLPLLLSR